MTARADYCFDQGASTEAASIRCAFVANCETAILEGRGPRFRGITGTREATAEWATQSD
jgi:hypothetical protein